MLSVALLCAPCIVHAVYLRLYPFMHVNTNAPNLRSFASGLQLRPIPGDHAIVSVRFPIRNRMQRAVDQPAMDLRTFATWTHTCTHPSVRPSVRLASVLAARLGLAYIRALRALSCGNTCDVSALRADIVPGSSLCSLWSLESISGSTTRQRKSTAGCLPTVLTMRYVRSLCTRTRLRPSVPITAASKSRHVRSAQRSA